MSTTNDNNRLDIYSLARDVARNFWVIILAALIGAMSMFMWNRGVFTPLYTSTATLIVNLKNSSSFSYNNLASSSEITQIFTDVFVQPTMKEYASEHLGRSGFFGDISAQPLEDTNIFTVSVTSSEPEVSYEELCAVLEVYPEISGTVFSDCIIDILREPDLPTYPSNSYSQSRIALAALGCAAVVLALILIISYLRDTVKNESIFKSEVDAKLFGTVCHERRVKNFAELKIYRVNKKALSPLVGNARTSFAFTEEYHKIASKIEYLNRSEGAKVFLLTSCAENEGKSTASANIALTLALRKKRVALLDMDFKKPSVHKIFGAAEADGPDLALYLSGEAAPNEYRFTQYKNTCLFLGLNHQSHFNYVDWIHTSGMVERVNALRDSGQFDFILMDTPPISVAADITALSQLADSTLLVVRTDCVYIGEINDVILSLSENSRSFSGCILNDVHKEFASLTQFGLNESGYYGHHNGYYGKYSGYHSYPHATTPISNDSEN